MCRRQPRGFAERLVLDTTASVIRWKGTKFWGLGKHEGTVRLASGYVVLGNGHVTSARFVADMRTIEVTEDHDGFRLTGDLTMRGVTHPIALGVAMHEESSGLLRATSRFRIDRHNWGVSFRGSRLTNDLVDDEIHFTLEFVLQPRRPA